MIKLILKFVFTHRKEVAVITITLLLFIITLVFSSQLVTSWSAFLIQEEVSRVEVVIQQELNFLSKQREQIISSKTINSALEKKDLLQLLTTVQAEAKNRGLSFIVVTDADGFVLARSHLPTQRGDNIFQATAHGRIIANGETVTAITPGVRTPLIFVSASQILDGALPIGGIIVGYTLDNSYANRFKKRYLQQDGQVAFYTSQEGIIGTSFTDEQTIPLINAYFSLGSDLVVQNLAGLSKEIKINDSYYVIRHIVFPGIGMGESPGGAFVFFPVRHNSYSLFLASGTILLFFVFYYLSFFLKFLFHPKQQIQVLLLAGPILFAVIYFVTLVKLNHSAIELKKSSHLIYNSVMKFEPEADMISQFSEKTIAIKVLTGGEAINAVSAIVNYDPKVVEILDILTTNSFCDPSFFVEKEISKEKTEARITCGIPNPGFSDPIGTVAELLIQPLGTKPISLEFTQETQVLANDGLGTDVLRMVTDGYYKVLPSGSTSTNTQNFIPIFSSSHPNSNRWYKNKNIKLSWPVLSGGTYHYTLSRSSTLSAEDKISSTTSNYLATSVNSGIYYFHLQTKDARAKSGPVSSFKIMVDAFPPLPPKIQVSSEAIKKGDVVRLDFKSEDILSGLQSGFYVKMNEGIFLPVKPPFYIPFIESGEYLITIRVFDNANNFSDNSIVIYVSD